jgi:hypothetical protein
MVVLMFIVFVSFLCLICGQGSRNQVRGNRDLSSSDAVVKEGKLAFHLVVIESLIKSAFSHLRLDIPLYEKTKINFDFILSLIVVLLTLFSLVGNQIHIYGMFKRIFPFYLLLSYPSMLYQHGNQKDGVIVLLILYSYINCFRYLQFSEIFTYFPLLFHLTDSELHNGGESRMWRGERLPFQGNIFPAFNYLFSSNYLLNEIEKHALIYMCMHISMIIGLCMNVIYS